MANLNDYLIVCDDFKGEIEIFFDYIVGKRELLKTLNLNKIIEDFLIFSDGLEIDVKELIRFYSFSASLLYLKTQVLYTVKLKEKKLFGRKMVRKLISFSKKNEKSKDVKQNLKHSVYSDISKVSFFRNASIFVESSGGGNNSPQSYMAVSSGIQKFKDSSVKASRRIRKYGEIWDNIKKSNVILGTYNARFLDKKNRIISILAKEGNCVFDFLLDPNDRCYFFEKFCYFLVVLECKMLNIIDMVYINGNLVLKKGKSIEQYE
ncbi:hypothetical protein [Borrelia sp. HM]|uniref:hypothetical protein n=1 Tax=Borrelia sp. HM TaxID=1882662 RepID=UPI001C77C134|nr:hypothetical protein [Borrelia sp. HM]BCR21574.1 hypothetical protein BKFM_00136 [Borrelia sp. HM]